MITSIHTLIYSDDAQVTRAFLMIASGADDMQLYQPTHKLAYNLNTLVLFVFFAFCLSCF
jgi:hypothetical protein